MFLGQLGICQFTSLSFHKIFVGFLDAFPVEKLLPGPTQENIWNFAYFLVGQAVPNRVMRQGVKLFFKFNVPLLLSPGFRILRPLSLVMIASSFLSWQVRLAYLFIALFLIVA